MLVNGFITGNQHSNIVSLDRAIVLISHASFRSPAAGMTADDQVFRVPGQEEEPSHHQVLPHVL